LFSLSYDRESQNKLPVNRNHSGCLVCETIPYGTQNVEKGRQ
jgi:hypothetical protein